MKKRTFRQSLVLSLLAGASLAGCATTDTKYSSLPPAPKHPAASGDAPAAAQMAAGTAFASRDPSSMPAGQFADILDRIRVGYGLPDVQHAAVDREIELYLSRPEFLDRTFKRGARYLYYIVGELEKRNMPLELALLPVVESAFNPVAYSRSRASGLWQFIPSSGRHYGLEQNWWIDERRDVIEATGAALTYLEYLKNYFGGDWFLAIAAYNGGEGTVGGAVRRNRAAGRPTDFFSLNLRSETRDYVPKLLAICRIVRSPEAYGLQFSAIPNVPYFDIVDPARQVDLGQAADIAGISRDDMFALNPGYNRMTTPPRGPHRLLLPVPNADIFRQAMLNPSPTSTLATVAVVEPPPVVHHRVRRGDTLSGIARRYDVPMAALREANGMRGSVIHPGASLVIPSTGAAASLGSLAAPRQEIASQLQERPRPAAATRPSVHVVKSGDTLWAIARRYNVSVDGLVAANGLSRGSSLSVGKRLEIPGGGTRIAAAQQGDRMTYQVRRGDTLSQIAERFNVSVRELMAWNSLRRATSLRAGQRLVLYVDPNQQSGG